MGLPCSAALGHSVEGWNRQQPALPVGKTAGSPHPHPPHPAGRFPVERLVFPSEEGQRVGSVDLTVAGPSCAPSSPRAVGPAPRLSAPLPVAAPGSCLELVWGWFPPGLGVVGLALPEPGVTHRQRQPPPVTLLRSCCCWQVATPAPRLQSSGI